MDGNSRTKRTTILALLVSFLTGAALQDVSAKDKPTPVDPNDPTFRFFQAVDASKAGKLTEFYVVAGVYKDPATPNEESQHILKIDYDKMRAFGKLQIVVRSVGKIQPDQMRAYTPKEFFEFGLADQEKYMKSDAGPFGRPGDMYLRSVTDRPLSSAPISDEIRKNYELLLTQHLLPALEKK